MTLSDIFTPTFDRLLVKPDAVADLMTNGLYRPVSAKLTRPKTGTILKAGPSCSDQDLFSPGLRVWHLPYDGKDMSLDGETVVHLSQTSIIGYEDNMIENSFVPLWDNLLVKDDEQPEDLGAGIVRPGTAQGPKARSGVIVSSGEGVSWPFLIGTRIIYGALDGVDVTRAGEVDPLVGHRVVSQMAILAHMDGGEPMNDVMGESWKEHICPNPGTVLAERAAQPITRGLIFVPDGVRLSSRSSEAILWDVASDVACFDPGERVFLAGSVSRSIPLGRREDIVLWVLRPREITGKVLVDPEREIEVEEYGHLAAAEDLRRQAKDLTAFEEGDTRAPR